MACPISMPCAVPSAPLKGRGRALRTPCRSDARRQMTCWARPSSAGVSMNSAGPRPPCSQPLCLHDAKAPFCGARRTASRPPFTRRGWHRRGLIRGELFWRECRARTISCMPPMRACAPAGIWSWKQCGELISGQGGGCSSLLKPAEGLALSSPWITSQMCRYCLPQRHAGTQRWPAARSGPRPSICIFT